MRTAVSVGSGSLLYYNPRDIPPDDAFQRSETDIRHVTSSQPDASTSPVVHRCPVRPLPRWSMSVWTTLPDSVNVDLGFIRCSHSVNYQNRSPDHRWRELCGVLELASKSFVGSRDLCQRRRPSPTICSQHLRSRTHRSHRLTSLHLTVFTPIDSLFAHLHSSSSPACLALCSADDGTWSSAVVGLLALQRSRPVLIPAPATQYFYKTVV